MESPVCPEHIVLVAQAQPGSACTVGPLGLLLFSSLKMSAGVMIYGD